MGALLTRAGNKKTQTAVLSVGSNSLLIVLKIVVGVVTGSVAVLSEAIHSGIDLVAALIAWFAVRVSSQRPDEEHPYGHGKVENISGTIEALLIFVAAAWIIYEAVRKLLDPEPVDMPVWGVAVMLVSAVVNTFVSRRLSKVGKETDSMALQADAWHLRTDVYTSLGVMFGLLVILIVRLIAPDLNDQLDRPGRCHRRGPHDHEGCVEPHPPGRPRPTRRQACPTRTWPGSPDLHLQDLAGRSQLPPPAHAQGGLKPFHRLPSRGRGHHVGG